MGLTVLGIAVSPGIEADETGINVASFSCRYFPEINRKTKNKKGETAGKVISTVPSRAITTSGEVIAGTGLMAATFIAVVTLANDITTFGVATGGVYLDDVTEEQTRDGDRMANFSFSSDPLLA